MGGDSYSFSSRQDRATRMNYASNNANDTFKQNVKGAIHEAMDPKGVKLREARDSSVHPRSVPIIIALDETGSMGQIPHYLVQEGLPHMMGRIIEHGTPDPAILFMGIGDAYCDRAPLQIGQFESGDEKLDEWLTKIYLEGNGGGNGGESYALAWYFAAFHTATDAWDKRGEKGFLFTIGDEHCHPDVTHDQLHKIMGHPYEMDLKALDLHKAASEKYDVFHICLSDGPILQRWKDMLKERCVEVQDYKMVPNVISEIVNSRISHVQREGTQRLITRAQGQLTA